MQEKKGEKKREFVTLIGDPGLAGRWTTRSRVDKGVPRSKIQELGKTRGDAHRGARRGMEKKRNEPCGACKGSCEILFFFFF